MCESPVVMMISPGCEIALLRQHQHQRREAGHVEGQAEKTVAGADVQLRRQPPPAT
jgi:hypothetical protein